MKVQNWPWTRSFSRLDAFSPSPSITTFGIKGWIRFISQGKRKNHPGCLLISRNIGMWWSEVLNWFNRGGGGQDWRPKCRTCRENEGAEKAPYKFLWILLRTNITYLDRKPSVIWSVEATSKKFRDIPGEVFDWGKITNDRIEWRDAQLHILQIWGIMISCTLNR